MERRDEKDPFDAATYTSPATIKSMVELRAFCAAFFEEHVRDSTTTTDQKLLEKFFNLICHSTLVFARARAVIPELQLQNPNSELPQVNPKIQRVLQMTEDLRRSPDSNRDHLIEESAWTRLAKDGQEQFKKKAERIARVVGENQPANSSSPLRPTTPASVAPTGSPAQKQQSAPPVSPLRLAAPAPTESMEAKGATHTETAFGAIEKHDSGRLLGLPDKPPVSEAGRNMKSIRLENIPTFIPGAQMGNSHDLIWSPTSGTRRRKPEEKIGGQARDLAVPARFGQEISGNTPRFVAPHPILSSLKENTPEKRHGRGLSTSVMVHSEPYHSPTSPLVPTGSPSTRLRSNTPSSHHVRNSFDVDPLLLSRPNSARPISEAVRQLHETGPADESAGSSFHPDSRNLRHSINRTPGVISPEPFSAPPRVSSFGDSHENDQGLYGGSRSTFHESQAHLGQYDAIGSPPFRPQPGQTPYVEAEDPLSQLQPCQGSFPLKPRHFQEHRSRPKRHHQSRREGQHSFAYPQQQPFNVNQSLWVPQSSDHVHQIQQLPYAVSTGESLIVPPPGSMHPVDYWNMLYQRGIDIHTRLASAGIPMTDMQRDYVARLGEARISAVASKLPLRGRMPPVEWLDVLAKELEEIHLPGTMPMTEVIVDRKKDYETAVKREIELVEVELCMK